MDFDQLEAVVESIIRLENFSRFAYCMDTFFAAQANHNAVKSHLNSLADSSYVPEKKKAMPFSEVQKQISALGI